MIGGARPHLALAGCAAVFAGGALLAPVLDRALLVTAVAVAIPAFVLFVSDGAIVRARPSLKEAWFWFLLGAIGVVWVSGLVHRDCPKYLGYERFLLQAAVGVIVLMVVRLFPGGSGAGPGDGREAEGWSARLGRTFRSRRHLLMIATASLAVAAFFNFGRFHGNNFVHYWEFTHYYMGAKYFPELGYDRLYEAFLAAEAEGRDEFRAFEALRDLRSNELVGIRESGSRVVEARGRFTPERWEAFKRDFAFFREQESLQRWRLLLRDHGYNPSPVWTMIGGALANGLSGAGLTIGQSVGLLSLLDVGLVGCMMLLVLIAFGFEAGMLAAFFWFNNPLVLADYTGGSFLRQDWIFALVAAVCLYRRGRGAAAGAALAISAGARVFPTVFALLPLGQLARELALRRTPAPELKRFAVAFGAVLALLVALSAASTGAGAWRSFFENVAEHDRGAYPNHVSLRTLVTYQPERTGSDYRDNWEHWRQDKQERFESLKPLYYIVLAGLVALFLAAFRNESVTAGMELSAFLPFLLFNPANYYYGFLVLLALYVAEKGRRAASGFFAVATVGTTANLFIVGKDVHAAFLSASLLTLFGWIALRRDAGAAAARRAR